jgi:hypothetical protein
VHLLPSKQTVRQFNQSATSNPNVLNQLRTALTSMNKYVKLFDLNNKFTVYDSDMRGVKTPTPLSHAVFASPDPQHHHSLRLLDEEFLFLEESFFGGPHLFCKSWSIRTATSVGVVFGHGVCSAVGTKTCNGCVLEDSCGFWAKSS